MTLLDRLREMPELRRMAVNAMPAYAAYAAACASISPEDWQAIVVVVEVAGEACTPHNGDELSALEMRQILMPALAKLEVK